MMKSFVVLAGLVVLAVAQRPFYAGSANRYPQVLPQYLTTVSDDVNANTVVNQRIDEETEPTLPPIDKPHDFYNDEKLLALISTWPKEKQPFWYLNREAIKKHLANRSPSVSTIPQRPPFSGSL